MISFRLWLLRYCKNIDAAFCIRSDSSPFCPPDSDVAVSRPWMSSLLQWLVLCNIGFFSSNYDFFDYCISKWFCSPRESPMSRLWSDRCGTCVTMRTFMLSLWYETIVSDFSIIIDFEGLYGAMYESVIIIEALRSSISGGGCRDIDLFISFSVVVKLLRLGCGMEKTGISALFVWIHSVPIKFIISSRLAELYL